MFIAVSFPQFFQEENCKSCCAANQNIVNGRKRNGENSARQHCSNDRQQYDGGRISKLMLKRDGKIVCNYDRGWDVEPIDENTQLALELLLHSENH